jgi:vacuolar-type H+-ATPase subunit I/STV1
MEKGEDLNGKVLQHEKELDECGTIRKRLEKEICNEKNEKNQTIDKMESELRPMREAFRVVLKKQRELVDVNKKLTGSLEKGVKHRNAQIAERDNRIIELENQLKTMLTNQSAEGVVIDSTHKSNLPMVKKSKTSTNHDATNGENTTYSLACISPKRVKRRGVWGIVQRKSNLKSKSNSRYL